MSKKTVVTIAAVVVIGAVAAAPMVTGSYAKKIFEQPADSLTSMQRQFAQRGLSLNVEPVSYEASFLGAEAVSRVKIYSLDDTDEGLCFDIKSEISHGYGDLIQGNASTIHSSLLDESDNAQCSIVNNPELAKKPEAAEIVNQFFADGKTPIVADTELSVMGSVTAHVHVAAQDITPDEKTSVNFKAMDFSFNDGEPMISSVTWGGLKVVDEKWGEVTTLVIGEVLGNSSQSAYSKTKDDSVKWLGDIDLSAKDVSFSSTRNDNATERFSFAEVSLTGSTDEDDGLVVSGGKLQLKDISVNDVSLGNFNFDSALHDVKADQFNELVLLLNQLSDDPQDITEQQGQSVIQHLLAAMSGATWELKSMELSQNDKHMQLAGNVHFSELEDTDAIAPQMLPFLLISKLDVAANVELDETLMNSLVNAGVALSDVDAETAAEMAQHRFAMMKAQLDDQVERGYGKYDEAAGRYSTEVSYKAGQLLVNGKAYGAE